MSGFLVFVCAARFALPCCGAGQLLTDSRQPMRWGSQSVRYTLDPGSLGALSPSQATRMVKEALSVWENVDTATIRFQQDGQFDTDVTADNVSEILAFARGSSVNPIIFDDNGGILNLILGTESARVILGLTQPAAAANGQIQYAWVILNGRYVGRGGFTTDAYFNTIVHEFGHFIGLDHSQLFRHLAHNRYGPDDQYIPVLFPVSTDDETLRARLTTDDRASVSMAYAHSSFSKVCGEIQGKVLAEGGQSFPGVNVAARKVDEPMTVATTCVSDYLRRGTGAYRLAGLPPGEYLLWVEPIDPSYYGNSQVGPYAETTSGLSFVRVARAEFYNGVRETSDESADNRSDAVTVTVKAGQIVKDIDFRVNRNPDPGDEESIQILASGRPETGAVEGSPGYQIMGNFQFMFVVSKEDDLMEVQVDTEPLARIQVYTRHEARAEFENYDSRGEGVGRVKFVRSRESVPPLQTGRYFVAIANKAGRTVPYTLTVRSLRYPDGDLNRDGRVDRLDLYHFSMHWQQDALADDAAGDLVRDGTNRVNDADLRRLIQLLEPPR